MHRLRANDDFAVEVMWMLSCNRRMCELCSVVVGLVSCHVILFCFPMSSTFKSHAV